MTLNLSELIAKYGDDKITFQKLDDCASSYNATRDGTRATFVTPEKFSMKGFDKLGLIVWMDRKTVEGLIAMSKGTS